MSMSDLRLSFFTRFSASSIFLSRASTWAMAMAMPAMKTNHNILREYVLPYCGACWSILGLYLLSSQKIMHAT